MSEHDDGFSDEVMQGLLDDPDIERLLREIEELDIDHDGASERLAPATAPPLSPAPAWVAAPMARVPRASNDLAPAWVDPEDMAFTPQPRPGKRAASRVFSMMFSGLFVAVIAWMIVPELNFRFLHEGELRYRDAILTAQPIPLSSTEPAVVEELYIDYARLDDEVLPAGTPIALLRQSTADGTGTEEVVLSVPFDARFVSVDAPVGSVIYPGQPVVTVYDPTLMSVLVTIRAGDLEDLRRGMRARMDNDAVGRTVHGTVDSAVPLLGTDHEPTTSRLVNVRIRPEMAEVADLVPGIRFRVAIETDSVDGDAPELVFTTGGANRVESVDEPSS